MATSFSKTSEGSIICYFKSIRYQDNVSISLYRISYLLLVCVSVLMSQVSAAENNVQDEFFSAVETKAIENKSPAFATEAASRLVKKSADINIALKLLNWSDIDGFQVVHLPSEELSKIKDLAVYNDLAVQAAVQIGEEAVRKKVDVSGASVSRFVRNFFSAYLVGIDGRQVKKDIYFTLSSGGFIPDKEECRLFAWVLAANGIRITRSDEKPGLLVLDHINATKDLMQGIGAAKKAGM